MKKVRLILVVLSAIYVVLTILLLFNDEALFNNFNLLSLIDYLQGWMVVSLVLLTAVIVVGTLYIRSLKSRYNKLENEHNQVKGRVFEIEEERKAEMARQKEEEEETERKLEAFNMSLKDRDRRDSAKPGPRPDEEGPEIIEPDAAEPGPVGPDSTGPRRGEIDLGRLEDEPRDSPRTLPPGRPSSEGDKPA